MTSAKSSRALIDTLENLTPGFNAQGLVDHTPDAAATAAEGPLFPRIDQSFEYGPIKVHYVVDISKPEVEADATVLGIKAGEIVLNAQKQRAQLGGEVFGQKAVAVLELHIPERKVTYDITVQIVNIPQQHVEGVLFSW